MNSAPIGPVLITGCSTGIGRAIAERLLAAGTPVYATARVPRTLERLERAGARTLPLDVTDDASMVRAVAEVESDHGAVGALVNNAGYGVYGPVEEIPLAEVRKEFETNVFGTGRLCQLVLPGMRRAGRGTIVNVSSMAGRFSLPTGGWYHASKYAVEALSDALRLEVAPFGIRVVLIEPGIIRTDFETVATRTLAGDGPYADLRNASAALMSRTYASRMGRGPQSVATTVERALRARRPRARYLVTPGARALVGFRRVTPDPLWDAVARRRYGLRRTPGRERRDG